MPVADPSTVNREMNLLYPIFANRVNNALAKCHALGLDIEIFETWRSPQRQDHLYASGRTRPGKIVTGSRAWQSWHQYGLAVDIAAKRAGKWSWDFDAKKAAEAFLAEGLEWLNPYEQCHFELRNGLRIDQARSLTQSAGVQRLWQEVG